MQTFAIEVPVKADGDLRTLLDVAKVWIVGSPHREIPSDQVDRAFLNVGTPLAHGRERILVATSNGADCSLVGVQFSHVERNSLRWSTELVGNKTSDDFRVAVRVSCEALVPKANLPRAKKPYIVRQLLAALGGGVDGSIPVLEAPHLLNNGDIEYAAALIRGEESRNLPVVYVSALPMGGYLLNPRRLAAWLSGMAHVFVEPNRWFSARLMQEVDRQNPYGGIIGVYWPNGEGPRRFFGSRADQTPRELGEAISEDIRAALANKQPERRLTWAFLEEARSRKALEDLRQKGSTELNEYVHQFDAEIEAKKEQLGAAEREIWRLRAEVRRLEAGERLGSILKEGSEIDLFSGERVAIVVDAMRAALANVKADSRRHHVLTDLIAANCDESDRDDIESSLRAVLEAYRSMDASKRAQLERLGFTITEEGKHYKAVFMGDGRYTFSIPKTSSDHRSGLNLLSDIRTTIL